MSPSWISRPPDYPGKQYPADDMSKAEPRSCFSARGRRFWFILCGTLLIIAIALGVGLGVGLTRGSSSGSASSTPSPPLTNTTNATTGSFWTPHAGASWQIVLEYPLNDTSLDVAVYDIDLFDNPSSTISALHAMNRSVICYFSAGSYENWRPDADQFKPSDYAKELDGWPGEYWLNTNSSNVRNIMSARLALAASKGCDGVDPDNVDGYDNDTGLDLTTSDAVDYLTFLAIGAHSLNMSLGLKNAGEIVNQTIDMMQWEVNEQCVQYDECDTFQPFIAAEKPVFHIEYPSSAPDVSAATKASICDDSSAQGFSTILKDMDLDNWVEAC
jgi:endo-alpha-1,4-polygalactosaminidase (GH114 family)